MTSWVGGVLCGRGWGWLAMTSVAAPLSDGVTSEGPLVRIDRQVGRLVVLRRLFAVAFTFAKLTLLWALDRLWLRRLWSWMRRRPYERLEAPRQLRLAFEDLGPTYIKFGQMIASSEGLFPRQVSVEFQRCLDRVPPFSRARVRQILDAELSGGLADTFASFEERPVAAASIAQVHFATLRDGTPVAVKVQRPHLRRRVAADLRIMLRLARVVEWVSRRMRLANLVGIIEDFAVTLTEEMDFRLEARNMEAFNALFGKEPGNRVCAPAVHWEATTARVLTMERFEGWRVDAPEARERSADPEGDLVAGLVAWFRSILEAGFFHGDVHAGNLMFLSDGRIGFLDFGIIGRFDEQKKRLAMGFMLSLATRNYRQLADLVLESGSAARPERIDRAQLAVDLERAYAPLAGSAMAELNYQEIMPSIMRASVKHGLKFPQEFVLITKQLLYFDRYARLLAPKLNLFRDPRIFMVVASRLPQLAGPEALALAAA
jgi:predicted unusual protein kinase regulating ubiquinone biosynthesis (AarF/ABC1/UbiB family)